MFFKQLLSIVIFSFIFLGNINSLKAEELFLFYNVYSNDLSEISTNSNHVAEVFQELFGDLEENSSQANINNFYVAKLDDKRYMFTLNSSYNCAQLGCLTKVYQNEGDFFSPDGSYHPINCKEYSEDKLLCKRAGYKVKKIEKNTKIKNKKREPVHYPAPKIVR